MSPTGSPAPLTVALALESDGPGGAEWTLIHLAEGIRARGHRVVPFVPEHGEGWLGGQLVDRGFAPRTFHIAHPLDVGCVRRLRRHFREERVSVVHAHEFSLSVFATAATRFGGPPCIVTLHSAEGFPDRLRRRVAIRWAIRNASAATTVSDATRTLLARRLSVDPSALDVIPNGVPVPEGVRERSRRDLGLSDETRLLLAVGNLYPVKGHDVLIRALGILATRTDLPPWKLMIAGRGGQGQELERLASELQVASRVELLGFREDVGALLHAADLFVHPSRNEGLPLAVIEAQSVGLPVIASRVGGIPEAIRDGETGLLVEPEEASELAAAVASLLTDREQAGRIGAAARGAAADRYGITAMIDRYLGLYRRAAAST